MERKNWKLNNFNITTSVLLQWALKNTSAMLGSYGTPVHGVGNDCLKD
jgi:hypothetical protein